MKLVTRKTQHPCAGLTKAQRRDFELIATGQRPLGGYKTIRALARLCLIEKLAPKIVGRDALGPIAIPQWEVPIRVHIQWCKWCSEQSEATDTGSVT